MSSFEWNVEKAYYSQKIGKSKTYFEVIDLPVSERETVMKELNRMGITAASLFPGLDGVCRALKEKYF